MIPTVVEIVYIADGWGDGPPWLLVVRLGDGRWVYFSHVVEITGEVYTTIVFARSLEMLWWGAMTEDDRDRVTAQMTSDRVDEAMVELDALLQTGDPSVCSHAEHRMKQLACADIAASWTLRPRSPCTGWCSAETAGGSRLGTQLGGIVARDTRRATLAGW